MRPRRNLLWRSDAFREKLIAANLTQNTTVSRAQNHLSWHSARRGAIAADLALIAATGDEGDEKATAGVLLAALTRSARA